MKEENLGFLWSEWSHIVEIEIIVMIILSSVLLPLLAMMISFYSIFFLALILILAVTIKYGRNPSFFFTFYSSLILYYSFFSTYQSFFNKSLLMAYLFIWSIPLGLGTAIDLIKRQKEEHKREYALRKEIEKKLQEREKKYRTIVENADELIYILDPLGHILYVNRAQEKTLGFDASSLIGRKFLEIPSLKEEQEILQDYFVQLREKGKMESMTFSLLSKDGEKRIFHCRGKVLTDNLGRPYQILLISSDMTEKIKKEEKIRYLSYHDSLTGLYNRSFFEEEMKRLDTSKELPLSIIMGDVNGLKLVNDAFGHHHGDILLKKMAKVLTDSCRKEDIIIRWGGDEFVILLPKSKDLICENVCQRIRENCKKAGTTPIPISISLGYATKNKPTVPFESIIQQAENRMYDEKLKTSQKARYIILQSLIDLVKVKSNETDLHIKKIQHLGLLMGDALNFSKELKERLQKLITLHDIGKSSIDINILKKQGPLSLKEWRIMKEHPVSGYHIARSLDVYAPIADALLAHHEHWDGGGYPKGLTGDKIPLLSRIIGIIDAYDVMTSAQHYHEKPLTQEEALLELKKGAGRQFDPYLVEVFLEEIH